MKILVGILALFGAWALFFRKHLFYTFNRWMREYAFSDQWVIFSGNRVAILLLVLGSIAVFSGLDRLRFQPGLSPQQIETLLAGARAEIEKGDYKKAVRRATTVIRFSPKNVQAHEILALNYLLSGDQAKFEIELKKIVDLNPAYQIKKSMIAPFLNRKAPSRHANDKRR